MLLPAEQAVESWRGGCTTPPEWLQPAAMLDDNDLFLGLPLGLGEVWMD